MKKEGLPFDGLSSHKILENSNECILWSFCIFGHKNVPFRKDSNSHFSIFLDVWHQVQFQKNLMHRFRKLQNYWFWAHKRPISFILTITWILLKNPKTCFQLQVCLSICDIFVTSHFYPLINACHLVQFQENLLNTFPEKFRDVALHPKNAQFTPFHT